MKIKSLFPILLLGFVASVHVPQKLQVLTGNPITGDYVEARTASVFAGACHYNGELVTEGREAIVAWNILHGSWKEVDLTGVRAMAQVTSDANLGDVYSARKCELIIDSTATAAQAAAMSDLLYSREGHQLGEIKSIGRAPISFKHDDGTYIINAEGFAAMTVRSMPNNECCTQPHLVWYSPLMTLEHRKVGYTETSSYSAGTLGETWQRASENSAFYGAFIIAGK